MISISTEVFTAGCMYVGALIFILSGVFASMGVVLLLLHRIALRFASIHDVCAIAMELQKQGKLWRKSAK